MIKNSKHLVPKMLLSGLTFVIGVVLYYTLIVNFQIELVVIVTSLIIAGMVICMMIQFRRVLTKRGNCMLAICDILLDGITDDTNNGSINR